MDANRRSLLSYLLLVVLVAGLFENGQAVWANPETLSSIKKTSGVHEKSRGLRGAVIPSQDDMDLFSQMLGPFLFPHFPLYEPNESLPREKQAPGMTEDSNVLSSPFSAFSDPGFSPMFMFPMFGNMVKNAFASSGLDVLGPKITTDVAEEEGVCLITVDLNGLPESSIVDVTLDDDGFVTVEYNMRMSRTNETVEETDGSLKQGPQNNPIFQLDKESMKDEDGTSSIRAKSMGSNRRRLQPESGRLGRHVEVNSEESSMAPPLFSSMSLSNVFTSNSFRLDPSCDGAGVSLAKATVIDDQHLLKIKFPLKKPTVTSPEAVPHPVSADQTKSLDAPSLKSEETSSVREKTESRVGGQSLEEAFDQNEEPTVDMWHAAEPPALKAPTELEVKSKKRFVIPLVRLEEF